MTFKTNILSLTIFLATTIGYVRCQSCPVEPCTADMPSLNQDQDLTLTFYWDPTGNSRIDRIYTSICQVISACGQRLKISLKPGATVKEVDGQMQCGNICEAERQVGCFVKLDPKYATTCKMPTPGAAAAKSCIEKKESDKLLMDNGRDRAAKNIPELCVPAVTFNDKFDLCARYDTIEELKTYVCRLYKDSLQCCKPSG